MAIRFIDIKIDTNRTWDQLKQQYANWLGVQNSSNDWGQVKQSTTVGQPIFIQIEVIDNDWLRVKDEHTSWQTVLDSYETWEDLKNY